MEPVYCQCYRIFSGSFTRSTFERTPLIFYFMHSNLIMSIWNLYCCWILCCKWNYGKGGECLGEQSVLPKAHMGSFLLFCSALNRITSRYWLTEISHRVYLAKVSVYQTYKCTWNSLPKLQSWSKKERLAFLGYSLFDYSVDVYVPLWRILS